MMSCDLAGRAPARAAAWCAPAPIPIETAARDALKAYLRIGHDAEDGLLDRLLASAIAHGEALTGLLFLIRDVSETASALPAWRKLGAGPVRAIGALERLAIDGTATPLPVDAFAIDIDGAGDGWVLVRSPTGGGRVRIAYRAGIAADWDGLPEPLGQGAIRLAAHLYTHRDDDDEAPPPAAIAALWRPWRRMRLA